MLLQPTDFFLLADFYAISSSVKTSDNSLLYTIALNKDHAIFKGHFEQMPIVPGVCQTQIIKELLQQEINKPLVFTKGTNIKFTGMIIPTKHADITIELSYKEEEGVYTVDAKLFFEEVTFTKFKGVFNSTLN